MPEVPGGAAVDVAVSLAFFLFVLSVVSATVTELISSALNWRGRMLRDAVGRLLGEDAAREFYASRPIQLLHGPRGRLPSYIPADLFGARAEEFGRLMDRVTGWYKRRTQWTLLAVALLGCAALNADVATIAERVLNDEALKEGALAAREEIAAAGQLDLPFGWTDATTPGDLGGWLAKVAGLFVTAISIPAGAAFWFDVLSKLSRQRATGTREGATARDDPDGLDASNAPGVPDA